MWTLFANVVVFEVVVTVISMGTWPLIGYERKVARAKSGVEKRVNGRNHEDPGYFCALPGPRFQAASLFPSFSRLRPNCSYSTPPLAAMKSGSEKRAKRGRTTHPQISHGHSSLAFVCVTTKWAKKELLVLYSSHSSHGLDNNMCAPVLISAFSWISSPLDHDTLLWDKHWSWAKCPFLYLRTRETSWR